MTRLYYNKSKDYLAFYYCTNNDKKYYIRISTNKWLSHGINVDMFHVPAKAELNKVIEINMDTYTNIKNTQLKVFASKLVNYVDLLYINMSDGKLLIKLDEELFIGKHNHFIEMRISKFHNNYKQLSLTHFYNKLTMDERTNLEHLLFDFNSRELIKSMFSVCE